MAENIFFAVEVETGKATPKLEKLRASFKHVQAEIKEVNKSLKEETITYGEANKKLTKLDNELIKSRKAYSAANKAAIEAEKSVSKGARAFLKTEKAAAKASTQLKKTKNVSDSLASTFRKVAAAALAAFATRAIISGIKDAINIIKNFEQSSANLAAVLGKNINQMQALQNSAKALGATTSFTASQVVELQTELGKLSFSEDDILAATEATLALAEASGSDLAQAARVAGSTIRALGLEAEDMTRLSDVMAKSFSSTALDMTKFEESMKLVAPAAKAVGVDLETVTAQLGVLANNGISGSVAGTQLNRVFIELNKAGLTLQEALDKVTNSQDKLGTATDLVGDRGAKALLIFSENQEKLVELKDAFQNAGGAAKKMAETQLDTLTGRTKLLSSAWEGFVLSLDSGEGLISKLVNGVVELSTNVLGAVTSQEKFSEQLALTNAELNAEFDVLKNGNITAEQRRNLIDDINTQYGGPGGYIENLLTESSTLKEIEAAQVGANKAIKEKIRLVATQEIEAKILREAAEADIRILEITLKAAQFRSGAIDADRSGARGQLDQISANEREAKRIESHLDNLFETKEAAEEKLRLFRKLNAELLLGDQEGFFGSLLNLAEDAANSEAEINEIAGKRELTADEKRAIKKAERDRKIAEKKAAAKLKAEKIAKDKLETFLLSKDLKEVKALNKHFESINSLDIANNDEKLAIEKKYGEDLTALLEMQAKRRKDKKDAEDQADKDKATDENNKKLQAENAARQQALDGASKGLSDIQNLTNVFTDNKLREIDRISKEELTKINEREEQGAISRDRAEQQRRRLATDTDEQKQELEKKAFNRNKAFQLAQIGVNLAATLSSIQLAAATISAVTLGIGGIPYSTIASGIAIGSAALNIASVAAQKFKRGGILNGPSHDNGGIQMMVGGRAVAEAEGGEPILTSGVSKNPSLLAAASMINQMAGGVSLTGSNYMQDGGVLSQNLPTFELPSSGGISDDILAAISGIVINSTVAVSEINSAQNNVAVAESQASI